MNAPHESSSFPFAGQAEWFRQELERLFERLRDQGERALDVVGLRPAGGWNPGFDLIETPEDVTVTLDVPGLCADSLDVQIAGNMLTVRGERPAPAAVAGATVHVQNRPTGAFSRSIPMPAPVNHEQVSATLNDGVLTVRLAKAEIARTRSVPVVSVAKAQRPSEAGDAGGIVET